MQAFVKTLQRPAADRIDGMIADRYVLLRGPAGARWGLVADGYDALERESKLSQTERIRQRAHELWEQEGRPEGRQDEHWARACREVQREGQ
jgi:hypothetical protein